MRSKVRIVIIPPEHFKDSCVQNMSKEKPSKNKDTVFVMRKGSIVEVSKQILRWRAKLEKLKKGIPSR